MSFELALRITEVLLAFAFLQQSAEHIFHIRGEGLQFLPRFFLCIPLAMGLYTNWVLLGLCVHSLAILHRYQGPYNGGSDRMGLLTLYCLSLAHWLPDHFLQEAALGYLALQLILSYFVSGLVKVTNPQWRSGQALEDVFRFSVYPVSEHFRHLADRPRLIFGASWAVMIFEVLFPISVFHNAALVLALCFAAVFHMANAFLFGLNRFVWAWIAAYPSLLWLHGRLLPPL